ncbi:MAG: hypothetical protein AAGJ73_04890 [Pseudomonadota bacterium]
MGFALSRSQASDQSDKHSGQKSSGKPAKRSPLAGWLGRKGPVDEPDLPEIDVTAGLNRILTSTPKATKKDQHTDEEPIRTSLAAIEAALYSIDQVRDVIEQAYDVALSARDVEDAGGRALLAESYDELRLSIGTTLDSADEYAAVLIGKDQRHIDVPLGGKAHYSISPTRLDVSSKGLNLDPPRDAFATFEEISQIMDELDAAIKKADRAAAGYCRDAQFLIARLSAGGEKA